MRGLTSNSLFKSLKLYRIPASNEMIRRLLEDNERVIGSLYRAYELAEAHQEMGISNFFQDRIDIHKKHSWMLRSILKRA